MPYQIKKKEVIMSDVQQGRILANPFSLHTNQGHSAQDHSQVYVAKANSLGRRMTEFPSFLITLLSAP